MSGAASGGDGAIDARIVSALFASQGIQDAWEPLPATGVANRIYATGDVVLRVATDYPDAIPDARTESVAAPAARAAGILTPRLLAFDDSRELIDRPWSLWERVHGETMGLIDLEPGRLASLWWQIGRELARLHHRVAECPDPRGYLDVPQRPLDLALHLERMAREGLVDSAQAEGAASLIRELERLVAHPVESRFLHDDVHTMNLMCTGEGDLLALIDWGDAGWGDPTLELVFTPLAFLRDLIAGYETELPGGLGAFPEARFVWDKLHYAMRNVVKGRALTLPLDTLRGFLDASR